MYIVGLADINKVCRICLEVNAVTKHLYLDERYEMCFADILYTSFGIKVDEHEHLPNIVCEICIEEICNVYKFKQQIERANKCWQDYLIKLENDCVKRDDVLIIQQEPSTSDDNIIEISSEVLEKTDMYFDANNIKDSSTTKIPPKYICHQCKAVFPNYKQLLKHKRLFSHFKYKRVPCSQCKLLVCAYNYKQHLLKHSNNHTCEKCNRSFPNKFNLQRHILTHTKEMPYSCNICNARFSRHDKLKTHIIDHGDVGEQFYCDYCGQTFCYDEFKLHKNNCLNNSGDTNLTKYKRLFTCKLCHKTFTLLLSLKTHMLLHTGNSLLCSECGKPYANAAKLKTHKTNVHNKKSLKTQYLCSICANQYTTKGGLNDHIQISHLGIRAHVCKYCSKSFTRASSLQTHQLLHTGEKPYVCHICSKAFNKPHNLHRHLKIHTNDRPFECTICNKRFTCKRNLVVHIRSHTGEKPFQCPDCDKNFTENNSMKKHQKIHLHTL